MSSLPVSLYIVYDSKFLNSLFWFDNDFEIESKYHRKICCLVVLARILSSQNVVFRSMFFLIEMLFCCV